MAASAGESAASKSSPAASNDPPEDKKKDSSHMKSYRTPRLSKGSFCEGHLGLLAMVFALISVGVAISYPTLRPRIGTWLRKRGLPLPRTKTGEDALGSWN
eukprot:1382757-Amorphochlora_amoeboformis.AAC.1